MAHCLTGERSAGADNCRSRSAQELIRVCEYAAACTIMAQSHPLCRCRRCGMCTLDFTSLCLGAALPAVCVR